MVTQSPFFVVFYDKGGSAGVERIPVGNMNSFKEWGRLYPDNVFTLPESLERLAGIVKERDPEKIAIGAGRNINLERALGSKYASRLVLADNLRNRWVEYRTPRQIEAFGKIIDITHDVIAEAFSNKCITPDVTTTTDVDFWVRQRVSDLGFDYNFGPTVMVWRSLEENKKYGDPEDHFRIDIPPHCGNNNIIRRGDVISCDIGIKYLGVSTDIQQVAYVLKEGETDVPEGLKEALRRGNRLQDVFAAEWKQGLTGNQILFAALEKAFAEDLRPEIYSHTMGSFAIRYGFKGGAPSKSSASYGPSFGSEGLFDEEGNQLPTRGGERILNYNTSYSMELDITYALPEWDGQDIRIVLEEDVAFTEDGVIFPGGRQTEWHVIR